VIDMFRTKIFDWTRTLCYVSNAWNHVKPHNIYAHKTKPLKLLGRKDREALRRIEFGREMAIAYTPRVQQTIH
jgi:hypothetical protein